MNFPILSASYHWNHAVLVCLSLAYFTQRSSSRAHPFAACVRVSLLLSNTRCVDIHRLLTHSVNGHLCCFYLLDFVKNAAMNTGIQVPVQVSAVNHFACTPSSGNAGPMVLLLLAFWGTSRVSHSRCAVSHSHRHGTVAQSLHVLTNTDFLFWICISLVCSDVQCLFMCLLAICTPSVEKCLVSPLPIFELGYFFLLDVFSLFCSMTISG